MLLWVMAGAYPIVARFRDRRLEVWERYVYLYVVFYLVPVVLVADVTSYGGRMVVVVLPLAILMALRALDLLTAATRAGTH